MVEHRTRRRRRGFAWRCGFLLAGLAIAAWISPATKEEERHLRRAVEGSVASSRRLDEVVNNITATGGGGGSSDNDDCPRKVGWGLTVLWIVVVLYMFLGIAIVCDELFVPALEIVAEKWKLSDDVSGATLMAAGGSAPELATSLIGTFSRSEVGFGTIVGSAVFNVLFVIAMCALFTPQHMAPLKLTWWPLARDCSYYVVTLAMLGVWFAWTTPNRVVAWEAAVQFCLYIGYVVLMSQNERLERYVKVKLLGMSVDEETASLEMSSTSDRLHPSRPSEEFVTPSSSAPRRLSSAVSNASSSKKQRPTAFRAGIGRLVLGQGDFSSAQIAGMGIVTQISGDVDATFAQLDSENRGFLDVKDLRRLLAELGCDDEDEEVDQLQKQLDSNGDGSIDRTEFKVWYIQSEARLKAEVRRVFDLFDVNRDGLVEVSEIESVLQALSGSSKDQTRQALSTFPVERGGVSFEQFQNWYEQTMFWAKHKTEAASAAKSLLSSVLEAAQHVFTCGSNPEQIARDDTSQADVPQPERQSSTFGDDDDSSALSPLSRFGVLLTLPLNLALAVTVPDCRVPGREHQCYYTFAMSICWIGAFSYTMVTGIEIIGAQFGVPEFLMGLIFLAAGTSVPDLLSSVVVAKQGKGDMAVSSSIGSNIFDVSVGLPLPWLLFTAFEWDNVVVAGKVAVSISILLVMVLCVIGSIAVSGWQMSLKLGAFMFLLYILYIIQEILRANFGKC